MLFRSIFEDVPSEEVATLLDADLGLIRKAQSIAVHELTRNLGLQGRTSITAKTYLPATELEHA